MKDMDELSERSKKAHQEDVRQFDKGQNALCYIVIGGILLVIAALFLVLSFKRVKNKIGGIDPLSLQFFICCICAAIAVVLLTIGVVRLIKSVRRRKALAREITEINIEKEKNI